MIFVGHKICQKFQICQTLFQRQVSPIHQLFDQPIKGNQLLMNPILGFDENIPKDSFSQVFQNGLEKNRFATSVKFLKWGASFRWSSSLYCPMRNSVQITIEKTHSTLCSDLKYNDLKTHPEPHCCTKVIENMADFERLHRLI